MLRLATGSPPISCVRSHGSRAAGTRRRDLALAPLGCFNSCQGQHQASVSPIEQIRCRAPTVARSFWHRCSGKPARGRSRSRRTTGDLATCSGTQTKRVAFIRRIRTRESGPRRLSSTFARFWTPESVASPNSLQQLVAVAAQHRTRDRNTTRCNSCPETRNTNVYPPWYHCSRAQRGCAHRFRTAHPKKQHSLAQDMRRAFSAFSS